MHELSACASIAEIVNRRAAQRRVETIHLKIGQLRQIVPDTLVYCWSVLSADTELDGSALEIEDVVARISCNDCGHETAVGDIPLFMCAGCQGVNVTVTAGEEFLITALDLVGA